MNTQNTHTLNNFDVLHDRGIHILSLCHCVSFAQHLTAWTHAGPTKNPKQTKNPTTQGSKQTHKSMHSPGLRECC